MKMSKSKPVFIALRVEKDQADFIFRHAQKMGVSMSEYLRKVIRSFMVHNNEN